ncbi:MULTISPECIES: cytochrome P450 [unclassified Sphingomonas]|uniref:cytochrome P450 n=1 Tax=unclassified Sphingomonas TaxID=196159 RepID=UPI0006F9D5DB|nr:MULTISPECIES: cytochrome P450 [unclassified Sphingomonas]KQX23386.1 hypothetical protein ASD17_03530 [Sphingomonas sp. Root1294]KQY68237.1 hypothetical protein ASD39_06050 [Sphingomonas sp. Root50]KRB91134.1 hypothetical protein ASE22_12850 [Sphingomonas sp. Root720]
MTIAASKDIDWQTANPLSADIAQCPYGYYSQIRDNAPVLKAPGTDFYIVSRYQDVAEVLKRPEIFSADYRSLFNRHPDVAQILDQGVPSVSTLATLDPPDHARYRRLVNKAFTPGRVNAISDRIVAEVETLIDGLIEAGEADIVGQFAVPLTISITADQLGVPREDIWKFKRWSDARVVQFSLVTSLEEECEAARRRLEFQRYFADLLDRKRAEPSDDIISVLATTHFDDLDRELDLPEFISIAEQLMTAGNLTTTHSFASGLLMLLQNPDEMERLRAEPARMRQFIEELLRLESPASGIWRVVREDTVLGGVALPAGAAVHLRLASANRDERQFADPDRLDLDRSNLATHVAFGGGTHFCIGFQLAKRELEIGFNALLRRLANIRLAMPTDDLAYIPSFTVHGLERLDIRFDRA